MSKLLNNITADPIQRHTILFEESEIVLDLRFYPRQNFWAGSVEYKEKAVKGFKLTVEVLHLLNTVFPFDFVVLDNSGNGIDPFLIDDFSNLRCSIYLLEPSDIEIIRGMEVSL